ncbi:MAG TPA: hypothetical protein VEG37_07000 [Burkholderiales bacterium]|nr:hypothetical protein [Burkholderiales bacterium]
MSGLNGTHGPHTGEDHGSIHEGINPGQILKMVIAPHPDKK